MAGHPFYSSSIGREGRALIEEEANQMWSRRGESELELKKKKIRKTITEAEEFWLTVAYDTLEILKSVALGRYVSGPDGVAFLEDVFQVYRAGLYPCGVKSDGSLAAFDVRVLRD